MPLTTGLVSYWKLDEASGSRADSAGSHALTDHASTLSATGKIGNGASFVRASSQYLSTADAADLRPSTKLSLSFWMKRTDTTIGDLISKWTGAGTDRTFIVRANSSGDIIVYLDGAAGYGYTGTGIITTGAFSHVVVVYDGTLTGNANRLKVYIDGSQQALTFDASTVPATLPSGVADVTIGGAANYYDGVIDEAGYWVGTALSSADVTSLYGSGSGLAYPFSSSGEGLSLFQSSLVRKSSFRSESVGG